METAALSALHGLPNPPIHITGDPALDWVVFLGGYFIVLRTLAYWIMAAHLARQGIVFVVENVLWGAVAWFFAAAYVHATPPVNPTMQLVPWLAALLVFFVKSSALRSRRIPL